MRPSIARRNASGSSPSMNFVVMPSRGRATLQLVVGAAVEEARGDDVVAGAGDGGERQELRRLAGGDRDRRRAAFERRDALLEDVGGRIHDPGVDVAELLQREEARAVRRIREGVGGRLVDRHGARIRSRRRLLAGVHLQRVEMQGRGSSAGAAGGRSSSLRSSGSPRTASGPEPWRAATVCESGPDTERPASAVPSRVSRSSNRWDCDATR